jgi:hypothetical protein
MSEGNLSGLHVWLVAGFASTVISFSLSRDANTNVSHPYAHQDAETLGEGGARASSLSPDGADATEWWA